VPLDRPLLDALRRRVEADPASIAFARLAEEYRRDGRLEEAVRMCRLGLAQHPTYISARVTLGRALLALGRVDEAALELEAVLGEAPENLAAIRALAEARERRGDQASAHDLYRRALALNGRDPELQDRIARVMPGEPATPAGESPPSSLDDLLVALGGSRDHPAPPSVEALLSGKSPSPTHDGLGLVPTSTADDGSDALGALEAGLRQHVPANAPRLDARDQAIIDDLERWLDVLIEAREGTPARSA
jgi:tetratricopeptide (TPR) repeat protein